MSKRICMLFFLLLAAGHSHAQSTEITPVKDDHLSSLYYIGIGNQNELIFQEILSNLQSDPGVVVTKYCTTDRKISFKVINNAYKSFDLIKDQIQTLTPEAKVYRKLKESYSEACNLEQMKQ